MTVTMEKLYKKIEGLEHKVTVLEKALVPEIKISKKEMAELDKAVKEMESGDELSFEEVFDK